MNNINSWEAQTKELMQRVEKEIEEVENDTKQRVAELQNRKWALEEALKAYQQMMGTKLTSRVKWLSPDYVRSHSYREVLCLIAENNSGLLVARNAIRLMKEVNAFGDALNPDSIVFSVLHRSKEFVKVGRGVYKLNGANKRQASRRKSRSTLGLKEAIRNLKAVNPDMSKQDVCDTLVRRGFDFGGKNPKRAVNMIWVNLGYSRKEKQQSLIP